MRILRVDLSYGAELHGAVVVIDENDKIVHTELVPDIKQEPNYDKALVALK